MKFLHEVNGPKASPFTQQDQQAQQKMRVFIPRKIWEELRYRTMVEKIEFSMYAEMEKKQVPYRLSHDIYVKRLLPWVVEQENTSATTVISAGRRRRLFEDEEEDEFKDLSHPKNFQNSSKFNFAIHSHGNLNVFWSSTDEENIGNWDAGKEVVSMVINNDMDYKIRYDSLSPYRITHEDIELYFTEDEELVNQMLKEGEATKKWLEEEREKRSKELAKNRQNQMAGYPHGFDMWDEQFNHNHFSGYYQSPTKTPKKGKVKGKTKKKKGSGTPKFGNESAWEYCELLGRSVPSSIRTFYNRHSRFDSQTGKKVAFMEWWNGLSEQEQSTGAYASLYLSHEAELQTFTKALKPEHVEILYEDELLTRRENEIAKAKEANVKGTKKNKESQAKRVQEEEGIDGTAAALVDDNYPDCDYICTLLNSQQIVYPDSDRDLINMMANYEDAEMDREETKDNCFVFKTLDEYPIMTKIERSFFTHLRSHPTDNSSSFVATTMDWINSHFTKGYDATHMPLVSMDLYAIVSFCLGEDLGKFIFSGLSPLDLDDVYNAHSDFIVYLSSVGKYQVDTFGGLDTMTTDVDLPTQPLNRLEKLIYQTKEK